MPTLEPLPSDLPDSIRAAIEQRREYGLRTDLDWVLAVVEDPTADTAFGFHMLPSEEEAIWARQAFLLGFAESADRYAADHRDAFGGLYLDLANERIVTLWTDNLDEHLSAILELAGSDAPIVALKVRWSERTLRRVQRQISRDWDWFDEIAAAPMGAGSRLMQNVVWVTISSANPDAPRLIAGHYAQKLDVPAEMIHVESDGTGVELMPRGAVKGVIVTADGERPGRNDLFVNWTPDDAGQCGIPYLGSGVPRSGKVEFWCTRGWWTAEAQVGDLADIEAFVTVSDPVRVRVRPGRTATIRIELRPGVSVRVDDDDEP